MHDKTLKEEREKVREDWHTHRKESREENIDQNSKRLGCGCVEDYCLVKAL